MIHTGQLHYVPMSWPIYALLFIALSILTVLIQIGLMRFVYSRLGISPGTAMLLLFASLLGSYVNIPVTYLPAVRKSIDIFGDGDIVLPDADWSGTLIAINLGGAVIPILLSLFLLVKNRIWLPAIIATAVVSVVCHAVAKPVEGAGIAIPVFIPPVAACIVSCLVAWRQAAPVAYVSGSLGTLIGADLMNFASIRELGTPIASIGGAGTFDGIFVTGIFAVILASLIGAISPGNHAKDAA